MDIKDLILEVGKLSLEDRVNLLLVHGTGASGLTPAALEFAVQTAEQKEGEALFKKVQETEAMQEYNAKDVAAQLSAARAPVTAGLEYLWHRLKRPDNGWELRSKDQRQVVGMITSAQPRAWSSVVYGDGCRLLWPSMIDAMLAVERAAQKAAPPPAPKTDIAEAVAVAEAAAQLEHGLRMRSSIPGCLWYSLPGEDWELRQVDGPNRWGVVALEGAAWRPIVATQVGLQPLCDTREQAMAMVESAAKRVLQATGHAPKSPGSKTAGPMRREHRPERISHIYTWARGTDMDGNPADVKRPFMTIASFQPAPGEPIGLGVAFCAEGDQFSRAVGYRRAMALAMSAMVADLGSPRAPQFWAVKLPPDASAKLQEHVRLLRLNAAGERPGGTLRYRRTESQRWELFLAFCESFGIKARPYMGKKEKNR